MTLRLCPGASRRGGTDTRCLGSKIPAFPERSQSLAVEAAPSSLSRPVLPS